MQNEIRRKRSIFKTKLDDLWSKSITFTRSDDGTMVGNAITLNYYMIDGMVWYGIVWYGMVCSLSCSGDNSCSPVGGDRIVDGSGYDAISTELTCHMDQHPYAHPDNNQSIVCFNAVLIILYALSSIVVCTTNRINRKITISILV